jgi:hypothetical protein
MGDLEGESDDRLFEEGDRAFRRLVILDASCTKREQRSMAT